MQRVTAHQSRDDQAGRLGRVLAASSEEVYLLDVASLRFLDVARGAAERLGYDADAFAAMTLPDILPEYDLPALRRLIAPLREGSQRRVVLQTLHRRRDGTTYPVEIRLQQVADEAGPVLLAIASDDGERRAIDSVLRRIDRAMTALTRATEAMIQAHDRIELLDRVCRTVVEVGGYPLAWVGWVRHDAARSIEPVARFGFETDYVDRARLSWDDVPRGRGPAGIAVRTGRPQVAHDTNSEPCFGPWREAAQRHGFASVLALPLVVQDAVEGVLLIYAGEPDAFDADETRLLEDLARNLSYGIAALGAEERRRAAQHRLVESQERYRALVELSPDAILAHRDGRIVFANAAADRIFRTPPDQRLEGRRIQDFADPDEGAAADPIRPSPPEHPVERRLRRLDGEVFAAEVLGADISYHGVASRLMVVRDVTERRQVQDQLIQAAKLATLGEMAAGMAHELSQPLNVVRMASEGALMLIERGRATDAYKEQQFALIADQTRRMADIIDHIRIFSRKDSGAVEVFDASRAARLALELFERQLSGENIVVSASTTTAACPVLGRPIQLEQVVMNLLANAADSIRQRRRDGRDAAPGRLDVVTTCSEDLGLVWISVSDNGTGIPPGSLERVFEPFFTTKDVGHGTGLGLSISFGIVSSMNGRIDACNNQQGASFVVTLPLAKGGPAPTPTPAPAPAAVAAKGRHLLVVDDEPDAVEAMAICLREYGYRVTTATNGFDAWERFAADPADLVVTDLRMPKGDGRMLMERLRRHDPLLPIIVVTGHMGPAAIDDLDDELAVVLNKPVSLHILTETVEQFLEG